MIRDGISKILVRGVNWIGDAIMALPALNAIHEGYKGAHIHVLCNPWTYEIYRLQPFIKGIILYQKPRSFLMYPLEILKVVKEIRKRNFDMAVLFQNAFEAALIAYLSGIKIRVGYATDMRGPLLTHIIERNRKIDSLHHSEYYKGIVRGMGLKIRDEIPRLHISDQLKERGCEILKRFGVKNRTELIGICPGAEYGPAKRWPEEYFSKIADMAIESLGAEVVIMGSGKEKEICKKVELGMRHSPISLCGRTSLMDVIGIIKNLKVLVCNDSGLMHVASALNTPLVSIFGSTDPKRTGPLSANSRVIQGSVECSPCFKTHCENGYICLKSVKVKDVWREVEELWHIVK